MMIQITDEQLDMFEGYGGKSREFWAAIIAILQSDQPLSGAIHDVCEHVIATNLAYKVQIAMNTKGRHRKQEPSEE